MCLRFVIKHNIWLTQFNHHIPRVRGFTVVELLIVIVVIAILASIIIVSYNGIITRAKTAVLQNDLSSGYTQLAASQAETGKYPASSPLQSNSGTIFIYNQSSDGLAFCLQASNSGLTYYISNLTSRPQQGMLLH